MQELIARLKPAVIVLDNVVMFPAILKSGVPWVRVVSCAETEVPDPDVPPHLSGCSSYGPLGMGRVQQRLRERRGPRP